jgi:DNA-binding beta-propeller fold protein YncE
MSSYFKWSGTDGGPAVTAVIPVGPDPRDVAVDPGSHTAYVVNYLGNSVSVITRCRC